MREQKGDTERKLSSLKVGNRQGDLVPLRTIARFETHDSRLLVSHEQYKRVQNVNAEVNLKETDALTVVEEFTPKIAGVLKGFPGYSIGIAGESEDTRDSISSLFRALVIASACILAILIVTFNSFSQPLLILFTIPMGFVGVVWALLLHGRPMSFMAGLGVVALVGVIVNNGIVFVDYFNKLRKKGKEVHEALIETAGTRLRPIILTSVTTICGLIPTAYGIGGQDGFIMALAIALSWGLLVGSLLTTLTLPCLMSIGADIQWLLRYLFVRSFRQSQQRGI